jgi:hypothetical protein
VANTAAARIGASRHGNFSSSPAVAMTSPVMSARIVSGAKLIHARQPVGGFAALRPIPCNTTVVRTRPTTGTMMTTGVDPAATLSIPALSASVMAMTTAAPMKAPNVPPTAEMVRLDHRDVGVCGPIALTGRS